MREAAADPKPQIRAAGSHWSLSEAVADPRYEGRIVETQGLANTLFDIVPETLSPAVKEDLVGQPEAVPGTWDESVYNLYHVEAGIRIFDLYARLDDTDQPLPTDVLRVPALAGPWALPTLGGAGGQTIAGVISTCRSSARAATASVRSET